MSRRWAHIANAVLCALCIGLGGGVYAGGLPARLGVLPVFAIASVTLCYGVVWWMQRSPSVLNMPDQAAYDALSDDQQRRVIDCTLPFFYGSVALWTGFGLVTALVPETALLIGALVLAHIVEGAMVIRFLLLRAPRKARELRDAPQDQSR